MSGLRTALAGACPKLIQGIVAVLSTPLLCRPSSSNPTSSGFQLGKRSFSIVSGDSFQSWPELVTALQQRQVISSPVVADIMLCVERIAFAHTRGMAVHPVDALSDNSVGLGQGLRLSAPSLHALALELLLPHLQLLTGQLPRGQGPSSRQPAGQSGDDGEDRSSRERQAWRRPVQVLDVGCGSGYLTACLAVLLGYKGKVLGVDKAERMVQLARWNLCHQVPQVMDPTQVNNVTLLTGNVLQEGWLEEQGGPWDAIHVGASCPHLPDVLLRALAPGGRMVIPIGRPLEPQWLTIVDKDGAGRVHLHREVQVNYTPLTPPASQIDWRGEGGAHLRIG